MSSVEPWLKIRSLKTEQGRSSAVQHFNLNVSAQERALLLGESPEQVDVFAGVLAGDVPVLQGKLIIDGSERAWGDMALHRRAGICVLDPKSIGHDDLKVYEQLALEKAHGFQLWPRLSKWKTHAHELLAQIGLERKTTFDMSQLNEAERRLMVLLGTLNKKPRLLLLRNFLMVSDDDQLLKMEEVLNHFKAPETSVLWCEHQLSRLPTSLDQVHLLKGGQVILSESFAQLDRKEMMRLMVTPGPSLPSKIDDPEIFYQLLRYNENILLDMPIAILLLDKHHRVQLVNTRAKNLLGDDSVLGIELSLYFKERHPRLSQWLEEHLSLEEGGALSSCPWTQNENVQTVSCRCFPIHDRVGRIGVMVMMDDQTDLERWRQQASTAEILHSTGFMAAGVAHEINNPLEITKNYLDLLGRQSLQGLASEAIVGIAEELEQIRIIVGQLVSISSEQDLVAEPFCVHQLVHTVFKLLGKKLQEHHFEAVLDLKPQTLEMFGSPSHMRQILLNLVKNAIEASPDGGKITVICRSVERQDEGWVRITLEDRGPGLPKGMEESVFMPFFSTKGSSGSNMGIGLSLVKNMVHRLGGWIKAENTQQGCRFILEFPRQGPS